MDISRICDRLVLKLLDLLGFEPVYQRARLVAGSTAREISHLGWGVAPVRSKDHSP